MNRRKRDNGGLVLARVLTVLLALAACAAPPASAPIQNSAVHGTVVAVRPMPAAGGISATILAALGASSDEPGAGWVEVIVRTDDGQTLSLMRPGLGAPPVGAAMMLTRDGWEVRPVMGANAPG